MPLFDNIRNAELEAENIRKSATLEVEKMLDDAKVQANQKAIGIFDDTKATILKSNLETANYIESLDLKIKEENMQELNELEKLASVKVEDAINFIIKKVLEI